MKTKITKHTYGYKIENEKGQFLSFLFNPSDYSMSPRWDVGQCSYSWASEEDAREAKATAMQQNPDFFSDKAQAQTEGKV